MRGQACFLWVLLPALAVALSACDEKRAPPSEQTKAPAPAPVSKSPPTEAAPWFAGQWSFDGKVKSIAPALLLDEADRARASGKEPAVPAPATEESFVVRLSIDPSGQVGGTASLGKVEAEIRGNFEGETLRARFASGSWNGHLVAIRSGADLSGEVRTARLVGESEAPVAQAFLGQVTLKKAAIVAP